MRVNQEHKAKSTKSVDLTKPNRLSLAAVANNGEKLPDARTAIVYWHRELPPADAEAIGEHVVEATSAPIRATLIHRDELWNRCYENLMLQACIRLQQETIRLGGDYAHVLAESIDSKRSDAPAKMWLHGCFTYMLYRRPVGSHRQTIPQDTAINRPKPSDGCGECQKPVNHTVDRREGVQ